MPRVQREEATMNVLAHGTMDPPLRARVQRVSAFRPIAWLRLGRADLKKCALQDAAHAGLMIVLGWVLLIVLGAHPYLVAAALSGFLLGAPVMTTGLVEL